MPPPQQRTKSVPNIGPQLAGLKLGRESMNLDRPGMVSLILEVISKISANIFVEIKNWKYVQSQESYDAIYKVFIYICKWEK